MKALSKKAKDALKHLEAGAYFRHALESAWKGGEKFKVRLRAANGLVIAGFGFATRQELLDAGMLQQRPCARSSVWPTEHELKHVAEAPQIPLTINEPMRQRNGGYWDGAHAFKNGWKPMWERGKHFNPNYEAGYWEGWEDQKAGTLKTPEALAARVQ